MSDLIERLRTYPDRMILDPDSLMEEAADRIEELEKVLKVAGMALVLCDSTNPDAPVLDGDLWHKACEAIAAAERDDE